MWGDGSGASKPAMAVFDGNNYGKDLANAAIWLEASEADQDYDDGDGHYPGGGCTNSGCFVMLVLFTLFCVIPGLLITCVAYTFYG